MVRYKQEESYSKPRNIKDILEIALSREKAAVGFYEDMLTHSFAYAVSDLLVELRNVERHHVEIIEKKLAELRPPF